MNANSKKVFYRIILLLFCFIGYVAFAQTGGPTDPGCTDEDGNPIECPTPLPPGTGVPIDSNLAILVIGALTFGVHTIYNHKLNKKRPI